MLLRRVARPMMAGIFIYGGITALRAPHLHAQIAKPALDAVSPAIDKATQVVGKVAKKTPVTGPAGRPDEETLIKIDGWVKLIGGTLLALGIWPRLAAVALAGSLVPTTYAGHRYWGETDPQRKQEQIAHFLKNMGLLGGLLIAAADTEGKPSLGWRGRRAARLASTTASAQVAALSGAAKGVRGAISGTAHDVTGRISGAGHRTGGALAGLGAGIAGTASGMARGRAKRKARRRRRQAIAMAAKRGAELQKEAAKRAAALQLAASAPGVLGKASKRRGRFGRRKSTLVEQATKLGHDVATRASAFGAEVAHQASGMAKDARKRVSALAASGS